MTLYYHRRSTATTRKHPAMTQGADASAGCRICCRRWRWRRVTPLLFAAPYIGWLTAAVDSLPQVGTQSRGSVVRTATTSTAWYACRRPGGRPGFEDVRCQSPFGGSRRGRVLAIASSIMIFVARSFATILRGQSTASSPSRDDGNLRCARRRFY